MERSAPWSHESRVANSASASLAAGNPAVIPFPIPTPLLRKLFTQVRRGGTASKLGIGETSPPRKTLPSPPMKTASPCHTVISSPPIPLKRTAETHPGHYALTVLARIPEGGRYESCL